MLPRTARKDALYKVKSTENNLQKYIFKAIPIAPNLNTAERRLMPTNILASLSIGTKHRMMCMIVRMVHVSADEVGII